MTFSSNQQIKDRRPGEPIRWLYDGRLTAGRGHINGRPCDRAEWNSTVRDSVMVMKDGQKFVGHVMALNPGAALVVKSTHQGTPPASADPELVFPIAQDRHIVCEIVFGDFKLAPRI